MDGKIAFETPENVQVAYDQAGLGSRFLAWLVDFLLYTFAMTCLFIVLLLLGAASANLQSALRDWVVRDGDIAEDMPLYFLGFIVLVINLGGFLYFGLSEMFMDGRTIGKRYLGVRVVRSDGFALDHGSILLRNIFRVIDHLPLLWVVPLLSERGQRLGDMASRTVVIRERVQTLGRLHDSLLERNPAAAEYRFDAAALKKLRPADVAAMERILERWRKLAPAERDGFCEKLCAPLARRLNREAPPPEQYRRFLEDLLAAEYRHQLRRLG